MVDDIYSKLTRLMLIVLILPQPQFALEGKAAVMPVCSPTSISDGAASLAWLGLRSFVDVLMFCFVAHDLVIDIAGWFTDTCAAAAAVDCCLLVFLLAATWLAPPD